MVWCLYSSFVHGATNLVVGVLADRVRKSRFGKFRKTLIRCTFRLKILQQKCCSVFTFLYMQNIPFSYLTSGCFLLIFVHQ
jgi:hypothetical protein